MDGGVLGQDGDAAFTFQVVGVHDAIDQFLVGAKDAALAEHGVHQRGFAVVNVGNDGNVANSLIQAFLFYGETGVGRKPGRSGRSSHMVKPMRMLGAAETGLS